MVGVDVVAAWRVFSAMAATWPCFDLAYLVWPVGGTVGLWVGMLGRPPPPTFSRSWHAKVLHATVSELGPQRLPAAFGWWMIVRVRVRMPSVPHVALHADQGPNAVMSQSRGQAWFTFGCEPGALAQGSVWLRAPHEPPWLASCTIERKRV